MERMGSYEVLGRIARGGTADIFVARPACDDGPALLERRVVLKRLYPHVAADDAMLRMFVDEVRLMTLLRHPGIVEVLDLDEDDESCFAVLELVDGPSLSAALRLVDKQQRVMPVEVAVAIVHQLLVVLDFVHRATDPRTGAPLALVHRDVNPQNILLSRDGAVRLTDFGVALSIPARRGGLLSTTTTTGGTLKGKAHYTAPEQLLGRRVDARADLFAVGVSLYRALCGRFPFDGETHPDDDTGASVGGGRATAVGTIDAVLRHAPVPPSRVRGEVDNELERIILALLDKQPEARPDAPAAADAFERWLGDRGVDERAVVARFVTGLGLPSLLR